MHKSLFDCRFLGHCFFFFKNLWVVLNCFLLKFLNVVCFVDNVVIKYVFSNIYLIDIFVIEKYYFESKLLKSLIFEK